MTYHLSLFNKNTKNEQVGKNMEKFLRYDAPATAFEESLPLGNGSLGAVVYGKTDVERISLNHDTLWSGKPGQYMVEGAKESFDKAKA